MDESKQILGIIDELFPVRGAPQVRIQNLLSALPSWRRFAVGGRLAPCEPPEGHLLITRPSENRPLAFLLFMARLGWVARSTARKLRPDVVLLSVPKYEMLLFAPSLRPYAKTLILDFRDSLGFLDYGAYLSHFLPTFIAKPLGNILVRVNSWLQSRAIRAADIITVANEGIRRTINHPRVVVIPNGVDTDVFKPTSKVAFDGTRPLRLVYLGNFAEKDLFSWLSVLKGIPNVEVHLIGDGRNRAKAQREIEGISVITHGKVPHEELPALLSLMDLGFIFRKEGVDQSIPVCMFEYAAMNIPSVCNDTGIMADFVRRHGLGFVITRAEDLAALVRNIVRSPEHLKTFDSLHELAHREFSLRASRVAFSELLEGREGWRQLAANE